MLIELLLRLLHILPAILLAGGVFFMWIALAPATSTIDGPQRETLLTAVRGRWAKVVMASTALLLTTGIINAVSIIKDYKFENGLYHGLVLVKLLLALAIFFITAVIGGRSPLAEKFRQKLSFWLTVNAVLLLVLILAASTMKVSPRTPKIEAPTTAAAASLP